MMTIRFVPFLLTIWLLQFTPAQVCGQPVNSPRIVGGQASSDGAWPWQVSVLQSGYHICGGSLIDKEWVLSAAHCFYDALFPGQYNLVFGAYQLLNLSNNVDITYVRNIILHPAYNGKAGSRGDIALIQLLSPVNFTNNILPVCLPESSANFYTNNNCWVTGWGHIQSGVALEKPWTLQEVNVPLINQGICNILYNSAPVEHMTWNPIKPDMFCAGYAEGGKDSCQGDSGGPLVCKVQEGWTQAGIVSWGIGCGQRYHPGVYTSVSYYANWIDDIMHGRNTNSGSENDGPENNGSQNIPLVAIFILTPLLALLIMEAKAGETMTIVPSQLVVWLLQLMILQGAVSAETACGEPVTSPRIVGGQPANNGEWPWQVGIYINGAQACGGSLVANQWVVSAAHCFLEDGEYKVLLGAYQLSNPSTNMLDSSVQKVFSHPDYNGHDGSPGDIALVQLTSPVNFTDYILPVCLPDASIQFSSESNCWVTGWGQTQENVNLGAPGTLQELQVDFITRDTCNALYNTNPTAEIGTNPILPDMICAGYSEGGKDACWGDSGGPLVCQLNGIWNLAGVVSWGDGCARANRPGVYTSVTYYAGWIQATMDDGLTSTPAITLLLVSLAVALL
ncbi:serine protease 27-like [Sceloporus undulatus]|uniref:serine protease 27-like n=1 Tax=Sceloporus undulatus TaxID=8520 RepID=UPI001C4B8FD5|nr:serine protease 27-like [Sceloporus undulatus]